MTARLAGIDAARAVALVGMFAVHILPETGGGSAEALAHEIFGGRASALFAVLAGVGIALGSGGRRGPAAGTRPTAAAAAGLLVRAAVVGLLGLALVHLDPPVAVILAYYGLLFVVAVPLLRLPAGGLAAAAVLACGLTPVLSHLLRGPGPTWPGPQPDLTALAEPGALLGTLAVTGYYPVLTWSTYLLAGLAVGRLDLTRRRTAAVLFGGGAALAVAAALASAALLAAGGAEALGERLTRRRYGVVPADSWWWLAVRDAHTGTPFDLAHTTGAALAVLGAMLLLARIAGPIARLPAAVGAVPLTLYTLHVGAVAAHPHGGWTFLALNVAAAVGIGAALRLAGRRGPLEAAVSAAGARARRLVAPPAPHPHPGTGTRLSGGR